MLSFEDARRHYESVQQADDWGEDQRRDRGESNLLDSSADRLLDEDEVDFADPDDPMLDAPAPSAKGDGQVGGKKVALVGRFGSMNHGQARNVIESFGAKVIELPRGKTPQYEALVDWVVIGADQPPLSESELLPTALIDSAGRGEVEIIHETELWERLGLVELEQPVRRYWTPAMLADLLGISVRVIRRWHRCGLIRPVVTLHKLPYFDFAEVATAKRLAGWVAAGADWKAIEKRLAELIRVFPHSTRPLDQLTVLVQGKDVLLRQGDGLIEPGGQMRFDFDGGGEAESPATSHVYQQDEEDSPLLLAFADADRPPMLREHSESVADPLLREAYAAEDEDDLETAIDIYHAILARDGARAEISFQIGELLYRMNHLVAARERYYAAIELETDFVEARASLGAVLAELGQFDLAVAALRGALTFYNDYADVHYTLAKTLDRCDREVEALVHWQRLVELAPDGPWAEEARIRLGLDD